MACELRARDMLAMPSDTYIYVHRDNFIGRAGY